MPNDIRERGLPTMLRDYTLCRVHLIEQPGLFDVHVRDGRITSVEPSGHEPCDEFRWSSLTQLPLPLSRYDMEGRLLLPGFVDIHTHLDKALTLPYTNNPSGTLLGAIEAFERHGPLITGEDLYERTLRVARMAVACGTTTLRTHLNFGPNGELFEQSLDAMRAARRDLRDCIDLQLVLMCPVEQDPAVEAMLSRMAAADLVAVGGAPHLSTNPRGNLDWIINLARQYGVTVDVHLDETLNPEMRTLEQLAVAVRDLSFPRPVVAGHCVSLDAMPMTEAVRIAEQVAASVIGVVTLPGANLYLMAREDTCGVRRGLTRIRMLQQAGVSVAAASDNIQDVFHPYGIADPLEAAKLAAYCGHFQPQQAAAVLNMVSGVPGRLAVDANYGIRPGSVADMVLVDDHDALSALQTMCPNRWVFKRGVVVSARTTETVWAGEVPIHA